MTHFILEWYDDEAKLVESQYLDEYGSVPDHWSLKPFWVDRDRVIAFQDGVFVEPETMNGEVYYRQVEAPE